MTDIISYDPRLVSIGYFGQTVTGIADGTFITVTPAADLATFTTGADGGSATSVSADQSADIELTLFQNSSFNVFLAGLLNTYFANNSKWPSGAMVIKDPSSPFLPVLENVQLMKRPVYSRGAEQENVTWSFRAGRYTVLPQTSASAQYLAKALSALEAVSAIQDLIS